MKLFIKKLLLFTIVLFAADKLFTPLVLIAPELTPDKRLEKIVKGELSKEIIILGSSRGARNIIAGQIDEEMEGSAYNLSYPGSNVEFHEFLLQTLIHFDQKPDLLLLVIDEPYFFYPRDRMRFRYDVLYPLTKYSYIINTLIDRGENNELANFMALSRIHRQNLDISRWDFTPLDTIISCGSMPISFTRPKYDFKDALEKRKVEKSNFDFGEAPTLMSSFQRLIDLCNKNRIELILIYPPNFNDPDLQYIEKINSIAGINNSYYSFNTENPAYYDSTYYYDINHLKANGAEIYTNEIINFLFNFQEKGKVKY